jgi:HSP20 family protein
MIQRSTRKPRLPTFQRSAAQAMAPLQREIDRFFGDLASGWDTFGLGGADPSMDVVETQSGLEISVELPGLTADDVKMVVDGDTLTISGERPGEIQSVDRTHRSIERSYGEFSRSIHLPSSIDRTKISAVMKNGVLSVSAPRRPDIQVQTIVIKTA